MLKNTFCHIPGIGEINERKLWAGGVTSWDSDIESAYLRIPRSVLSSLPSHMKESRRQFENGNIRYFADTLECSQAWRLYPDFCESCGFLDIETTGLEAWQDITTAVLFDGREIRSYVNGQNLPQLRHDIKRSKLLITFNGARFDIPFIQRTLHIAIPHAHIDVRSALAKAGIKGPLKSCEQQLGIIRPEAMVDISGFMAPLLWYEYRTKGCRKSLETLLAYNAQDAANLLSLMIHAFNRNISNTPFSGCYSIPYPSPAQNPFKVDRDIVASLLRRSRASELPWAAAY